MSDTKRPSKRKRRKSTLPAFGAAGFSLAMSVDSDTARRWHRLADQYAVLAEELAAAEAGRTPILRTSSMQQQQQQQGKLDQG
jgi:hypothetical protein